jgi:hypothetical protein
MHVSAASCDYNLTAAYAILNNCVSPYAFDHNVIMSGAASGWPGSATGNGNWFPATSTVGFVNFNGGHGGDYHLISGSAFKNAGTDGKDVGADINAILTATAGVQ